MRATEACHRFNRGELAVADALLNEAWRAARHLGDPRLGWEVGAGGAVLNNVYLLDPEAARVWCGRARSQPRFETLAQAHAGMTDQLVYALATMGDLATARQEIAPLRDDAVSRRLLLLLDGHWEAAERSWAAAPGGAARRCWPGPTG